MLALDRLSFVRTMHLEVLLSRVLMALVVAAVVAVAAVVVTSERGSRFAQKLPLRGFVVQDFGRLGWRLEALFKM